jgi:hypothetical protein
MEYEYTIYCVCGSCTSRGGFSTPQNNLSDADVISKIAWHNGDCPVADSGQGVVTHGPNPDYPNVTVYTVAAV